MGTVALIIGCIVAIVLFSIAAINLIDGLRR